MRLSLVAIVATFFVLTGFSHQEDLEIVKVNTTINEAQKIITYDFKIRNNGKSNIGDGFDYPGYHFGGMEVVVVPDKELEGLMKMLRNTKYKKMESAGFGGQGSIYPNQVADFHASYYYRNTTDSKLLKKKALNGKVIILEGTNVIAELPLN